MHRLRTVTYLDVSAVAGHHAMPAALLLCDGQGTDRQAILSGDICCLPSELC